MQVGGSILRENFGYTPSCAFLELKQIVMRTTKEFAADAERFYGPEPVKGLVESWKVTVPHCHWRKNGCSVRALELHSISTIW